MNATEEEFVTFIEMRSAIFSFGRGRIALLGNLGQAGHGWMVRGGPVPFLFLSVDEEFGSLVDGALEFEFKGIVSRRRGGD
jgi:hypothetical protein